MDAVTGLLAVMIIIGITVKTSIITRSEDYAWVINSIFVCYSSGSNNKVFPFLDSWRRAFSAVVIAIAATKAAVTAERQALVQMVTKTIEVEHAVGH